MTLPVTSYWFASLPPEYARIGISRGSPRGQSGYKMYKALAPGPWFNRVSAVEYRDLYMDQLVQLDPQKVLSDLQALSGGRIPALLCFEKPTDFDAWCHRGFVSAWLKDTLDLDVFEFGLEDRGSGWRHPKLPSLTELGR